MAKIKLWLYNNPLTEDPNDYLAKVSSAGRFELDDFVDDIVADRSEYQAETIRSISTLLFKQIGKRLKEGYTVQTPLFSASLGVTGAFRSKTAQFTKNDHQLKIKLRTNGAFLDDLQEAEVEVLGVADVAGGIGKVTDSQTGAVNSTILTNVKYTPCKSARCKIEIIGVNSVFVNLFLYSFGNAKLSFLI